MALALGARLGPYQITVRIGVGGMGEVFRATDRSLERDVAIKVLPDAFAQDLDRVARFEREAKTLASLNHPNIATIHGLEKADGLRALVMELVEGPTLADRVAQGALTLDETLSVAKQIAGALEAAHEQGIVHRDLKPANIKVREDGTVKVLDFGLAKLVEGGQGIAARPADFSPTVTSPAMTGMGVILGTAAYMSPEQARGKVIDKRTDIWAFGCVLYEMLTGRRAFEGEDTTETIASVVRSTPDWSALPADVPPAIHLLLQRCLEKDRKQRVGDISTALFVLREVASLAVPSSPLVNTAAAAQLGWRRFGYMSTALLATGLAGGLAAWAVVRPDAAAAIRRVEATLTPLANTQGRRIGITHDGAAIYYFGTSPSGATALFARRMEQYDTRMLAEGTGLPFADPGGRWIGFIDIQAQALKRVPISGGPALQIAPLPGLGFRGATWGDDGSIIFATNDDGGKPGLYRVPAGGGEPILLASPNREAGEGDFSLPHFLPGSRAVLFTILPLGGFQNLLNAQIAVLDLRSAPPTPKIVVRGGSDPRYAASGHLVYLAGATLRAVAFDLDRLETRGADVEVLPEVGVRPIPAMGDFDIAADGTLIFSGAEGATLERTLIWVDRQSREEAIPAPARAYSYPRLSSDGTKVALDVLEQNRDIQVWNLVRNGPLVKVTSDPAPDRVPLWAPGDEYLMFGSTRDGKPGLFLQRADGTGVAQRLVDGGTVLPLSVFESTVVLQEGFNQTADITTLQLPALNRPHAEAAGAAVSASGAGTQADNAPRTTPLVKTPGSEMNAQVSPDGRWLVYRIERLRRVPDLREPIPGPELRSARVSCGGKDAGLVA